MSAGSASPRTIAGPVVAVKWFRFCAGIRVRPMPPCMSPMLGAGQTTAKSFSKPFSIPGGQFGLGGGGGAPARPRPPAAQGVNAP